MLDRGAAPLAPTATPSDPDLTGPLVPDEAALESLRELVKSHVRQPSLFRQNRDVVALFRTDGRVVTANPAAIAISGFGPGELIGGDFRQQISASDVARVVTDFRRAVRGETVEFELSIVHKTGRAIEIAAMLLPAIVEDRIVGVYAIGKNVTELKATERAFDRQIQELSSLIQHHPDSLVAIGRDGIVTQANASMEALIGYREDEMVGRRYGDFVSPDTLADATGVFLRAMAGENVRTSITIVHRTGRRIETMGTVVPIRVDGEVAGLYAIGHDVTEQRRLEASVAEHADRLRDLYIVAATTGRDPDAQIGAALELGARTLRCERAFLARVHERMVSVTQAIGFDGDVPRERPLAESLVRFPMQTGDIFAVDDLGAAPWNAILGKDDSRSTGVYAVPVDAGAQRYGAVVFTSRLRRSVPFSPADREFLRLVGALIGSAVERAAQQRRLDTLAFFDGLTGLPNRALLDERLARAIESARRRGTSFAVHFVDLDGFKEVNARYGHAHGDAVLRAIAQRFERVTRDEDVTARVGGDEFVVLQTYLETPGDALALGERLREAIGAPLETDGNVHRVAASVGIAIFPKDGDEPERLLQHADEALYRAKAAGGTGVARFAAEPRSPREA